MRLILDSNTLSHLLRERKSVVSRFSSATAGGAEFLLVPVVDHEVSRYLILKDSKKLLRRMEQLRAVWTPVPFGIDEWRAASELWAERHRTGRAISDFDLLIAIACQRASATLVTANTKHFDELGLPLLDGTAGLRSDAAQLILYGLKPRPLARIRSGTPSLPEHPDDSTRLLSMQIDQAWARRRTANPNQQVR